MARTKRSQRKYATRRSRTTLGAKRAARLALARMARSALYQRRRRIQTIPRGMNGFPAQRAVNFVCRNSQVVDFANFLSGDTYTYSFKANGLQDITKSFGGTDRPLGYNEWATFYNRYAIVGSKLSVTVEFIQKTDSVGQQTAMYTSPFRLILRLDDDDSVVDVAAAIEQGPAFTRTKLMNCTNAGIVPPVHLKKGFSAKKFFNTSAILSDDRCTAPFGQDPEQKAFYQLVFQNVSPITVETIQFKFWWTWQGKAILKEPKDLAVS